MNHENEHEKCLFLSVLPAQAVLGQKPMLHALNTEIEALCVRRI